MYCWLVEYCWSHHTKYVVTVTATLIAPLHTKEAKSLRWPVPVSSVQCRTVAAEQNLINLPSAETEPIFHFHSSPHFCCRHGHGTHNSHHRQQSNMFGNQTGFNNFKETLVVKVLEASTAPALVWLRHVVAAPRVLAVFVSPFHHYNHYNDPICNFPDIGTVMFTDGGAATVQQSPVIATAANIENRPHSIVVMLLGTAAQRGSGPLSSTVTSVPRNLVIS